MSNHFISLGTAVTMTTLYRAQKENILATDYKNKNILATCESFDRDAFDQVLAQKGCTGLRIYYGMNESNQVHAIIVGVNEDNEDMLPKTTETKNNSTTFDSSDDDQIIETALRCPDQCPPPSDLNP